MLDKTKQAPLQRRTPLRPGGRLRAKSSKPKKSKPKSIARLLNDCAELVQKLVKLKAADENGNLSCVTCQKRLHWSDAQGAHFISRKWTATKIMEENIHPCCARCNGPLGGNMIAYTLYMQDMYGRDFVEELQRMKHSPKKWNRAELMDLIEHYRAEVNRMLGEI